MSSILKSPKIPPPPPPAPMPDESAIDAAKKKAARMQMNRQGGRDSTILSEREGL